MPILPKRGDGMGIRKRAVEKWLPVALFLALILIGFLTSADYGQPWDEPWEQDILRMNYNQYAMFFGSGERLTLLSDIDIPESGLIEDSIERDHGVSAYYPVFFLVSGSMSPNARMVLWHAYTWLWFAAGAAALYFVSRRFGLSKLLSCVPALFLVLSPRFFAQGHYNNKDMVLLSLTLILILQTARLMEKQSPGRAIAFALFGAVAANTKIIGLFIYGVCVLAAFLPPLPERRKDSRYWISAGIAVFGLPAFYLLLTPAAWSDTIGYIRYTVQNAVGFTRWDHIVLFRGAVFHLDTAALPRYYLPYMMLVTTPLWLLAVTALGLGFALRDLIKRRKRPLPDRTARTLILCTALWLVPLLFAVVARPTLYNGWRHFYFLAAPLLCLSAYGFKRAADSLKGIRKPFLKYAAAGLLAALMILTGAGMVLSHPAQYAYYNQLLLGRNIPRYMELDYWNVSALPTVRKLLNSTEAKITIAGVDLWSQTGLEAACALLPPEEQGRVAVLQQGDADAEYLLVNPTYTNFSHWQPDGMELATQSESYGWPVCGIYAQNTPLP